MPVKQDERSVTLSLPSGAETTVHLFGATVTSWKTSDGKERLYLSERSTLDGSGPIRGGIPIAWPSTESGPTSEEVAENPLLKPHSILTNPKHQFARLLPWVLDSTDDSSARVSATFSLPASSFPGPFPKIGNVNYIVTLNDESLQTELRVKNPADNGDAMPMKSLFHNYFAVDNASKIRITGFKSGQRYLNGLKDNAEEVWKGGEVSMGSTTAMKMMGVSTPEGVTLHDGSTKLNITWQGMEDCILWNPGQATGKPPFDDMKPGDENRLACVEPAYINAWKNVAPGEEWVVSQTMRAE